MADLRRMLAEAFLALQRPTVTAVTSEVAEHRHRVLIGPDRGPRPTGRTQRHRPLLDVGRAPPPRVLASEHLEPAQRLIPTIHRRRRQQPALLLQTPARQNRLEHRRLGVQQHRTVDQHQTRRASHHTRSGHRHSASQPGPMLGATSLHQTQPRPRIPHRTTTTDARTRASSQPAKTQIPYGCSILKHVE
jgi:hypothetical protein